MKRFKKLALVSALLVIGVGAAVPANAATTANYDAIPAVYTADVAAGASTSPTSFDPAKFYAGASLGVLNSPYTTTNNFFTANNTTTPAAKAYAGVRVNEYFAVEAGTYTNIVITTGTQSLLPISALGVSAVGYLPIRNSFAPIFGDFAVFGKLGLAVPSFGSNGNLGGIYQMKNVTPTLGLGAEYSLSRQFAVRLEIEKFTDLGQINPLFLLGQQNQKLTATLTTVGLKYQF